MLPVVLAGFGLGLSLIVAIGAQNLFVLRQGIRREHALVVATVCAVSDAALIVVGVSGLGALLEAVPWLIDAARWAGAAFLAGYALLAARRVLRPSGAALTIGGSGVGSGGGSGPAGDGSDGVGSVGVGSVGVGSVGVGVGPESTLGGAESPSPGGQTAGSTTGGTVLATATAVAMRGRLGAVVLTCLALTWLNPHVYLDTVFLLGSVAATHGDQRWWFAAGAALASVVWFFSLAAGARYLGRWLGTPRAWRVLDGAIAVVMLALAVSLILPR